MADRKTALMWTVAWWFARRYMRRRAAMAVTGVAAAATARRGRLLTGFGVFALVALLVAAFLAWRKLFAQADAESIRFYSPGAEDGASPAGSLAASGADAA